MIYIILFHGTTDNNGLLIEKNGIDLSFSKLFLDFSKGFYTTDKQEFAWLTAKRRFSTSRHFPDLLGVIHGYAIVKLEYDDCYAKKNLRIKTFDRPTNEWAQFVIANRVEAGELIWGEYQNNRLQQYDIVCGPTADGTTLLTETIEKVGTGEMKISDVKSSMCKPASSRS